VSIIHIRPNSIDPLFGTALEAMHGHPVVTLKHADVCIKYIVVKCGVQLLMTANVHMGDAWHVQLSNQSRQLWCRALVDQKIIHADDSTHN